MHIVDIYVLWLLTITYVIRACLLDIDVMYVICYVVCVSSYGSIVDVCVLN